MTPAGASLTMYREIRSYANSIWDDNNNNNKVEKHNSEGKNVRRTLQRTKRKRKWYKKYSEKATSKKKTKKNVWLSSGRLHIEGRLNEGPRLQRKKHKDENEAKQNKRNTTERRHDICKPNAERTILYIMLHYSTPISPILILEPDIQYIIPNPISHNIR